MRARFVHLFVLQLVLGSLGAQEPPPPHRPERPRDSRTPVFSPGADAPTSAPAPTPDPVLKKNDAPARPPQDAPSGDVVDELLARFPKWPARVGKEAAVAISGYGDRALDRLIAALAHNDWRVQAAAAHALGLMKAKEAAPALIRAMREPTNRESLPELASALGRVDPERGPFEILPLLGTPSSRVREAALQALPPILDERHLEVVRALLGTTKGSAKAVLLGLFERVPGAIESDELYLALSDPETEVATTAAKLLGRLAGPAGMARVTSAAREGTLRSSAYAMLALTVAEDVRGLAPPLDDDALRLRGLRMLRSDDPFYRGAAAVFLVNLAYRSDEAALVETANQFLIPILLDAVAGGVFYSDYAAVAEFAFEKLEKLSGEPFGRNAPKWTAWWSRAGKGFVARRRLSSLDSESARLCVAYVQVVAADGAVRTAAFAGDRVRPIEVPSKAVLLGPAECEALRAAAMNLKFFSGGTDGSTAVDGGFIEIALGVGFRRFERRRAGAAAEELRPFADALFALDDAAAWQAFASSDAATRIMWIADRRAELEALAPAERERRVLDMALAGYASFGREGRAAALRTFGRASAEWRVDHAAALGACLRAETTFNDHSAAIVGLLGDSSAAETRDEVFALADRGDSPKLEATIDAYLAARDFPTAVAAFKGKSGLLRTLGARALARHGREPDAASHLMSGLRDPEARVREACVRALAKLGDPRTLAMIDAVLEGTDKPLRVRAIEALGAVAGDDAASRLAEIFREGDAYERAAVVRALERAGGARARAALQTIAREGADAMLATEAVVALARIGGADAAARVAALFRDASSRDVRLQSAGALAALLGVDAAPHLSPALTSDDPLVKRVASLALARAGGREAIPTLLEALDAPAGDAAAEDAFRRLTFFAPEGRTPHERALSARAFLDLHGAASRADWLRRALSEESFDVASLETRLAEGPIGAQGFATLLGALTGGSIAVREAADALLSLATGVAVPSLPLDADAATLADRRRVYEEWARDHRPALEAGVTSSIRFFEPSPPPK